MKRKEMWTLSTTTYILTHMYTTSNVHTGIILSPVSMVKNVAKFATTNIAQIWLDSSSEPLLNTNIKYYYCYNCTWVPKSKMDNGNDDLLLTSWNWALMHFSCCWCVDSITEVWYVEESHLVVTVGTSCFC